MGKIAVFFDIDGTLYRDSLMIAHMDQLINKKIIPKSVYWDEIKPLSDARKNREIDYESYLAKLINIYNYYLQQTSVEIIDKCATKAISLISKHVYNFTKTAINYHKSQGHKVIFISGSPDFMVERMGSVYNADLSFGSVYITKDNVYTGEIIPLWDHKSKNKMIERLVKNHDLELSKCYSYGDTHGDLEMLRRVGHPTAINPSAELISKIRSDDNLKKKTSIIVERKDVIYPIGKTTLRNLKFFNELEGLDD